MARITTKKEENNNNSPMAIKNTKGEVIGDYDSDMINTIKSTVAKNATDNELKVFLTLALTYDLDPFRKEIFFGKSEKSDKILIMISRDGYRKLVKKDPNYKYHVSDYVCENDTFKITKSGDNTDFVHEYSIDRGDLKGAYCILYTKSGEVYSYFAEFKKFNQSSTSLGWKNFPVDMIIKTAESRVFKSFANVTGLVPESDMDTVLKEELVEDEFIEVNNVIGDD